MEKPATEKLLHNLFEFSILIKGINGAWETISGLIILFVSKATINTFFLAVTQKELLEDPGDIFINFLGRSLQSFSTDAKTFAALYILVHGLLNIFFAIQLYRDKHWSYSAVIVMLTLFISYQIYRVATYHSMILLVVTVLDIFFVILTWHEYRHHKKNKKS